MIPYTLDSEDWKQIQIEGLRKGYESSVCVKWGTSMSTVRKYIVQHVNTPNLCHRSRIMQQD